MLNNFVELVKGADFISKEPGFRVFTNHLSFKFL
jgi:hypothetical protein